MYNLKDMDKVSVIQLVEGLKSLNLEKTPNFVIETMLEPLLEFHLPMVKIIKGSIVVRTRIVDDQFPLNKFTKASNLSYRTEKVDEIKLGRCNDVGESVFYCSLKTERLEPIQANTLEILPRLQDDINPIIQTVSGKWIFQENIYFPFIGGTRDNENLCNAGKNRFNFLDGLGNNDCEGDYLECLRIVDAFLCNEFSKEVINDYEYKISAVYSKMMRDRGMYGIIYPSVGSNEAGLNLALFPKSVDLEIIKCSLAIYSRFFTRKMNIINEHLMLANVDNGYLRWYEEYNHKLHPHMKKYYTGESDDNYFLKYFQYEDLGD